MLIINETYRFALGCGYCAAEHHHTHKEVKWLLFHGLILDWLVSCQGQPTNRHGLFRVCCHQWDMLELCFKSLQARKFKNHVQHRQVLPARLLIRRPVSQSYWVPRRRLCRGPVDLQWRLLFLQHLWPAESRPRSGWHSWNWNDFNFRPQFRDEARWLGDN